MTDVVVLGSGYGGTAAIKHLESAREDAEFDLTWVSKDDYHLVLHELHRVIRNPDAREDVVVPVEEIIDPSTRFVHGEVTGLETDERVVELADGSTVDYDYVLVCLGSRTAFYGIDGLAEHAHTLKSLDDALEINRHLTRAAREAGEDDPARVVVGGAGLSGIQAAGEIAEWRDGRAPPVEITLVEQQDRVFPGHDSEFQGALRKRIEDQDVDLVTGATISAVEDSTIHFDERGETDYDVLLWAGGITGREALSDAEVNTDHNRAHADETFRTSDDRVFAIGDSALVDQDEDDAPLTRETVWAAILDEDTEHTGTPPPTAEAAWEAAEVAADNIVRAIRGEDLESWHYTDKGTLVSVGDDVVAHDVVMVPVDTFGGEPAEVVKKAVGARWIGSISSWERAARAWPTL